MDQVPLRRVGCHRKGGIGDGVNTGGREEAIALMSQREAIFYVMPNVQLLQTRDRIQFWPFEIRSFGFVQDFGFRYEDLHLFTHYLSLTPGRSP